MKAKTTAASLVLRKPADGYAVLTVEYRDVNGSFKRISTGIKVNAKKNANGEYIFWDGATIKAAGSTDPTGDTRRAQKRLRDTNATIHRLHDTLNRYPSVSELTAAIDAQAAPVAEAVEEPELVEVLEAFILAGRPEWKSEGSKIMYRNLLANLKLWQQQTQKKRFIGLRDLTLTDTQSFQEWLTQPRETTGKRGTRTILSQDTTIQRRVKALRKFLSCYASELTFDYKKIQTLYTVKSESNYADVTLTPEEVAALETLDLSHSPRLHTVRNLFLLQCWTALAYIDLMQLQKHHVKAGRIVFDRQKTESGVNCPVFPVAGRILEEFNWKIPQLSNQVYNRYAKELMQHLDTMHEEITIEVKIGGKKTTRTGPRWEFVGTHSPRRSFATNMMLRPQVTQKMVMVWGGWTDYRSFNRYLNAAAGEAEAIAAILAS
ncbi:hypothetical protein KBK19_13635 [Microvirga sp. STR05]|uniref:Core-binding (CB) domain-containing protein n=1 Tax=Hymenobacter duratus TaxID=2771356 RepID=A0ABR8JNI2_9BACT|nr:hypothetical protein [Hymenobacter duratus]MBD2716079.1 hypothetical protein [Hymenobacter duratus]MBR7950993.1 hypothetical protein [Microvirga sp. STR05]